MLENIGINCFCPHCGNHINIQIERTGKVGGIIGGAISGAIMGSNVGIAAGPLGAIAGTIPGFVLGAILGENIGAKIDNPTCTNCNTSFKIPQQSIIEYKKRLKNIDEFIDNPLTGLEIITLRAEFYTYFYRFVELDPKNLLNKYTINEFDENFKQQILSDDGLYDLDVELNINNCSISSHLNIFQKLSHIFKLSVDYLPKITSSINDTHEGISVKVTAAEEFGHFIKYFRNSFYEQIRKSTNPNLQIILYNQTQSNVYDEVLCYFYFTTYYLLNMEKLIRMNLNKYPFEHLKTYSSQLSEYYSEHLIEMRSRLIDKVTIEK